MQYKSFSFEELQSISKKHTDVIIKETKSGMLLFILQGAKLLGMYPKIEGDNVLAVSRDLENYLQKHLPMGGGERLWISPERNFFYENPRDFDGYHVPSEIDPGEYIYIDDPNFIIYENTFSLLEYDRNKIFDNSHLKRVFKPIPDPYNTGLAFAGVSITDQITIVDTEIEISAWSLAQVFTSGTNEPGTAFFPVKSDCELLSYFDPIPPDRAQVFKNYARFKIDSDHIYKLAIKPEDIRFDNPCKIVYLSPTVSDSSLWLCVMKCSNDIAQSQAECVDMAKSNPDGPRGTIQAFNSYYDPSKPESFPFGELELQLTKGIVKNNITISKAKHELLSYIGSKEEMLELAKTALQLDTIPELY